jgi:hypothetical protein
LAGIQHRESDTTGTRRIVHKEQVYRSAQTTNERRRDDHVGIRAIEDLVDLDGKLQIGRAHENRREPQAWQVIMVIEQCQVAWQPTLLENSGEIHDRDIVDGQRDIHGAAAPATRLKKRLQARLDRFKLARVSVYVWYCK